MVTACPTGAFAGDKDWIVGAGLTIKFTPLLVTPLTVTVTFPVVAAVGTVATMRSGCQKVGAARVPLKLTELPPWLEPKLFPRILTPVPAGPPTGDRLVIVGV